MRHAPDDNADSTSASAEQRIARVLEPDESTELQSVAILMDAMARLGGGFRGKAWLSSDLSPQWGFAGCDL
jgi:hypothetical protein